MNLWHIYHHPGRSSTSTPKKKLYSSSSSSSSFMSAEEMSISTRCWTCLEALEIYILKLSTIFILFFRSEIWWVLGDASPPQSLSLKFKPKQGFLPGSPDKKNGRHRDLCSSPPHTPLPLDVRSYSVGVTPRPQQTGTYLPTKFSSIWPGVTVVLCGLDSAPSIKWSPGFDGRCFNKGLPYTNFLRNDGKGVNMFLTLRVHGGVIILHWGLDHELYWYIVTWHFQYVLPHDTNAWHGICVHVTISCNNFFVFGLNLCCNQSDT